MLKPRAPLPRPKPLAARPPRGFAIVEALVALLIFSIGALGLVGLQASMLRASTSAKYRAEAAYLAADLIGTLWTDVPNIAKYEGTACTDHTLCKNWMDKVAAALPAGSATLDVSGTTGLTPETAGLVSIKITWTLPQEGSHSYTTSAALNANPKTP